MTRRRIFVIAGIIILLAAIFFANRLISGSKGKTKQKSKPQQGQIVQVLEARPQTIRTYVDLTGRLIPAEKIDLYAEVQGVFHDYGKPFKVGVHYNNGEVLLNINADEVKQRLISMKAGFKSLLAGVVPDLKIDYPSLYEGYKDYLLSINMEARLKNLPEPNTQQQKLFLIGRNVYSQYYQIKELETRLNKFTIYAPYAGTLTEVYTNDGALIRPNQLVGEFVKDGAYELETAVSPENLMFIEEGQEVTLSPTGSPNAYNGRVSRINAKINEETQMVKIFIQIYHDDLQPGMYMEGKVNAREYDNVIKLQRDYLINDQYLFLVKDSIAHLERIELKKLSKDEAIVAGINEGQWIIAEDVSEALKGKKVSPQKKEDK